MNPSNASSAPGSAKASTTSPKTHDIPDGRADSPASKADEKLSESEFLTEQADAAKAAIAGAFAELKTDLAKGTDPRVWMKSHPWITLTSAAVAGFAAAATVVPSKEQPARHKLHALERATRHARNAEAPSNGNGHDGREKRGFIAMILHELFQVIKPAVISLLSAHFASPPAAPEEPEHQEAT